MKRKYIFFGMIVFLAISGLTIYSCIADPVLKEIMMVLISFIGAAAVFLQLNKTTSITTGEFILNLQNDYSENTEFVSFYLKCWQEYSSKNKVVDIEVDKDVLVNYLTFFESIYIMLERDVLNIKLLDDLFARRFFVVVNNRQVQEKELLEGNNYEYYINIYKLYHIWIKHRKEQEKKRRNAV